MATTAQVKNLYGCIQARRYLTYWNTVLKEIAGGGRWREEGRNRRLCRSFAKSRLWEKVRAPRADQHTIVLGGWWRFCSEPAMRVGAILYK